MTTILDLFETSVSKFSNNPYLWEKKDSQYQCYTYQSVYEKSKAFGAGLIAMGVEKGDRITLLADGCAAWVIAELGIFYAGAVSVPISVKINESQDLIFRLNHSGSKIIITTASQAKKIENCRNQITQVKTIIFLDTLIPLTNFSCDTFDNIIEKGTDFAQRNEEICKNRRQSILPSDYANICYTSGTTADPKGIILTHRNYTANTEQALSLIDVPSHYTTLLILPWDHSFAHTAGIYTLAKAGGSLAAVQLGKTPLETLKNIPTNIKEIKPHFLLSVPALAKNFKKNIEQAIAAKGKVIANLFLFALKTSYLYNGIGINKGKGWRKLLYPFVKLFDKIFYSKIRENFGGRLEFFVGGGALLDIELQKFFYAIGIPMLQGYGLTEASPIISANSLKNHKLGSSGKVVKPLEIKICDEDGRELPVGQKGEIVIKGENVMAGYWENPKATQETIKNGWLHTGDMGYLDADGYLYVLGRFKSLLIGNDGEKYSPEAIEEAIVNHSRYIEQCMLYNNQNPYTVALIVPNREAIKQWLKEKNTETPQNYVEQILQLIENDINEFKTGGKYQHMFPQRWLPAAIAILDEPFTEENKMINSTLKLVRGKVVEHYQKRIEELYTPEAKKITHSSNIEALMKLLSL
ncbi:MAG: AMP-binding protein [Bacteroidales bacterium]|nr:AMP-binding protein [Bacteroidales bacterium]